MRSRRRYSCIRDPAATSDHSGARGLFDHAAIQVDVENACPYWHRLRGQAGVNHAEEEQHEDEDECVLDADEKLPHRANEFHPGLDNYCYQCRTSGRVNVRPNLFDESRSL